MNEAVKVPLVKSEFLHYCQNPMTNTFGKGTIISMEIVQAPKSLQYMRLEEQSNSKPMSEKDRKDRVGHQESGDTNERNSYISGT